jgi:hypothetical protein
MCLFAVRRSIHQLSAFPAVSFQKWRRRASIALGLAAVVGVAYAQPPASVLGYSTLVVGAGAGGSSVWLEPWPAPWTATSNSAFLHIAPGSASGTGNAAVAFTWDAFNGTGTRTGTLTIAGTTFTVTQTGTNYFNARPLVTLATLGAVQVGGVAVDGSGYVYAMISANQQIAVYSPATQQVTTYPLGGYGIASDGAGNIYVANPNNNTVDKWNAATQQTTVLVSTGLHDPAGVALDSSGNVYIADTQNTAIKEWSAATQQVTTVLSYPAVS